ncbi:MAG TPA: 5'-nucleotidase C-terminal domain-containing protein, partial [Gemmatimonadales bacterium]|nr:5'-nucleotidase C-terminal domain-containing protein [Gemmatimonadales bacterium]
MPLLPLLAALAIAPADTVRLVLVASTDVHGYVTDWDYLQNISWPGGFARTATVVDSLRAQYPGSVVLVDAGDALNGSPMSSYIAKVAPRTPHPAIEAMNLLGYDAVTPGDRDLDYGADWFRQAITPSAFAWVSGNLQVLPADTNLFHTYTVLTRRNVRVGITGFTTPGAMVWNGDGTRNKLRVRPIEPAVQPVLREMRQDADLLIVLLHSGLEGPSTYDTAGVGPEHVGSRLASAGLKPDLVVLGHSLAEIRDTVINGVHYVQPRAEGRGLSVVHITMVSKAGGGYTPVSIRAERVSTEEATPSTRITRRMTDPHEGLLRWSSTVIGESDRRLGLAAARVEDTPLLRALHDLQRRVTRAQLSAIAVADPRATVMEGEITQGEIMRVYPWDYTLRAVKISGAQLKAFLEQSARYFYSDSTGRVATNRYVSPANYEVVSGAQYTIDLSQPMGSRITRLGVRGRPVEPTDSFTLALSSYRAQGSGNYGMLKGARVTYDKGESIRELFIADINRRRGIALGDMSTAEFTLAPAPLAAKARAIFVRDVAAPPPPDAPPPLQLPTTPTPRDLARQDSIMREQEKRDAAERAVIATMRLPGEADLGKGLLRLMADAYRNAFRADLAIVRVDEAGAGLPAGPLVTAQVNAAVRNDQPLLVLTMTGKQVLAVLEQVVSGEQPCCELAGFRVEYDSTAKPFERIRSVKLPGNRSLDGGKRYKVAISAALIENDVFLLGASDCKTRGGCKT